MKLHQIMRYFCILTVLVALFAGQRLEAQTSSVPQFGNVFLIVLENKDYSSEVGSSSMPYLNSLISKYGLATDYYATTHPSIGNYFSLTTGEILTNDDSATPSSFPVSNDNIIRKLVKSGKTWKDYAESIPSVGYLGGNSGNYYVRHNPIPYFTDVNCGTSACQVQAQNIVPFTQLATDIANNNLPDFGYIVPNACDDAHNCSLSTADNWLKNNIAPLINSAAFQKNGLLIITTDEDSSTGTSCSTSASVTSNCGGQVATVVISPLLKSSGLKISTFYNHFSLLRTMMQGLGLTTFPGVSASASPMTDFFGTANTSNTPVASLSPTSLNFGSVKTGSTSSPQTVTLKNTGTAALTISTITANGSFTESNTCPSSLAANTSCSISVSFSPQTSGTLIGTLSVADNATGSPQTVSLSGTGASGGFTLGVASGSSSSATVTAGGSATFMLTVAPVGTFTQAITLACTGAPSLATCTVSPSSVTFNGSSAQNVKVTVTTKTATLAAPRNPERPTPLWITILLGLLGITALGVRACLNPAPEGGFALPRRKARGFAMALSSFAGLLLIVMLWTACGSGGLTTPSSSPGTPAGNYVLMVTGTSGSMSRSTTFTLTVK